MNWLKFNKFFNSFNLYYRKFTNVTGKRNPMIRNYRNKVCSIRAFKINTFVEYTHLKFSVERESDSLNRDRERDIQHHTAAHRKAYTILNSSFHQVNTNNSYAETVGVSFIKHSRPVTHWKCTARNLFTKAPTIKGDEGWLTFQSVMQTEYKLVSISRAKLYFIYFKMLIWNIFKNLEGHSFTVIKF